MPEGDALYRFAEKLRSALDGKIIRAARSHGPGPVPRVEKIVGQRCTGVRSQGKNMLIGFENGLALRGHLRMYGTWHVYEPGERWTRRIPGWATVPQRRASQRVSGVTEKARAALTRMIGRY